MTNAFDALSQVPADFAVTPDDIWGGRARPHVEGINTAALRAIESRIADADNSPRSSVLGLPIVGEGGSGKSHLLAQARMRVQARDGFFVRLNVTDVFDFWASLSASYLYALNMPHRQAESGLAFLLETLAGLSDMPVELRKRLLESRSPSPESVSQFIESVRSLDQSVSNARNTLRALLLLHSSSERLAEVADVYLHGGPFDAESAPGYPKTPPKPHTDIVRELSQLMSLCGPTVIAVDQVDDIVRASKRTSDSEGEPIAGELLEMLGVGLMDLRDNTRRSTVLLACLDNTWQSFTGYTTATIRQRFVPEVKLRRNLPSAEVAAELLAGVLGPVYRDAGFEPPYPSYPFSAHSLRHASRFSPRQLLVQASAYINVCIENGEVKEAESLDPPPKPPHQQSGAAGAGDDFDAMFERLKTDAKINVYVAGADENKPRMSQLLAASLRAFQIESERDPARTSVHTPVGPSQNFHAELRDRTVDPERTWTFMAIANSHGNAVSSRVDGLYSYAQLGQNRLLRDAHGVLWVTAPDDQWGNWRTGTKAFNAMERFLRDGIVVMANEDDLRVLDAIRRLEAQRRPGFNAWLRDRRPASRTVLFRAVFGDPPDRDETAEPDLPSMPPGPASTPDRPVFEAPKRTTFIDVPLPPLSAKAVANGGTGKGGAIYVGAVGSGARSAVGAIGVAAKGHAVTKTAGSGEPPGPPPVAVRGDGSRLGLDLSSMAKHTGAFAGSGSGKTVLLRRIIEAAALQGVSSIVLDPNNDLSRLGTGWPEQPDTWLDGDEEAAETYHDEVEVVVWTPGRSSGRPLSFQPLPDFASVRSDHDEFEQVVDTAVASLVPRARIGRSTAKDDQSRAVLREALVAFAKGGRSDFSGFLDFLDDLPDHASSFAKAAETAARIAATLRAAAVNDRVFAGDGEPVDPGVLLQPGEGKRARVSVVNFLGLPAEEQRQGFVNQLELALFAWAKRNPAMGRPLSGLFVLDEAQVFAPSTGSTLCLDSTIALASQARKYGLGMLFATQSPKGIHNRIVGNCATHWYGRINSPSQIAAAAEVAQHKGGSPVDLAHLQRGQFYLVADGRPTELVEAPMCLSFHPPTAPTAEEILDAVRRSGRGGAHRE
jgi:hypothetical protein